MIEYHNYEELHEHSGNEKYEVITILPKEYEVGDVLLDKGNSNLNFYAKTNPIKKKEKK